MKSTLLYRLADLTAIDLHAISAQVRGFETRQIAIGQHWTAKSDVTVCVDQADDKLASAYVRVRKHLWAYLVVTMDDAWALLFDGDRAKIQVGREKEFGLGSASATLAKLKPSLLAGFQLAEEKNQWTPVDPQQLVA